MNIVNVRLSDTQLKKLETAVKDNTGTILRISLKMFDGNDLPHIIITDDETKNKEMLLIIMCQLI